MSEMYAGGNGKEKAKLGHGQQQFPPNNRRPTRECCQNVTPPTIREGSSCHVPAQARLSCNATTPGRNCLPELECKIKVVGAEGGRWGKGVGQEAGQVGEIGRRSLANVTNPVHCPQAKATTQFCLGSVAHLPPSRPTAPEEGASCLLSVHKSIGKGKVLPRGRSFCCCR